jgi:hypothetical protein
MKSELIKHPKEAEHEPRMDQELISWIREKIDEVSRHGYGQVKVIFHIVNGKIDRVEQVVTLSRKYYLEDDSPEELT